MEGRGQLPKWEKALVAVCLLLAIALGIAGRTHPEWFRPRAPDPVPLVTTVHGMAPAPTLKPGPKVKKGKRIMATWIVSDAGDDSYNGTYAESGTWGGQPTYVLNPEGTARWLWYDSISGHWYLSPVVNYAEPRYQGTGSTLPANAWSTTFFGTAPAPTVAEEAALPDWPWEWWWDGPFFGAPSPFAPCAATIGGVNYLAMAAENQALLKYGIVLFNLTTKEFSLVEAPSAFFGEMGYASHQGGALFDAGDGEHLYLNSGPREDDELGWCFTVLKLAVVPGEGVTVVDTKTVQTRSDPVNLSPDAPPGLVRALSYETALHECGHAAVCVSLGQTFTELTLEVDAQPGAVSRSGVMHHAPEITIGHRGPIPPQIMQGVAGLFVMAIMDGGRAARVLLGHPADASASDVAMYEANLERAIQAGLTREGAEARARHLSEGAVRHWQAGIRVAAERLVTHGRLTCEEFTQVLLTVPRGADDAGPEATTLILPHLIAAVMPKTPPGAQIALRQPV